MISQRVGDYLREMLYPVVLIAIIGSCYAFALARQGEAQVRDAMKIVPTPPAGIASISE